MATTSSPADPPADPSSTTCAPARRRPASARPAAASRRAATARKTTGTIASASDAVVSTESDIVERRIGTTVRGKWKLERVLGVGGMAAVYVGVHKIGRRDAIKILHPEIAANKEIAARFEQEAHAVNSFHHPGAVEILDVDVTEDGAPFLVMELLAGESVETRIERQLLSVKETLRVADELLDVLAQAHATGIVHR